MQRKEKRAEAADTSSADGHYRDVFSGSASARLCWFVPVTHTAEVQQRKEEVKVKRQREEEEDVFRRLTVNTVRSVRQEVDTQGLRFDTVQDH